MVMLEWAQRIMIAIKYNQWKQALDSLGWLLDYKLTCIHSSCNYKLLAFYLKILVLALIFKAF